MDGDEIYNARCIKIEHDGNQYSYLIHYNGWSKSYDEWMFDDDPRLNPEKVAESKLVERPKTPPPPPKPSPPVVKPEKSIKIEKPKQKVGKRKQYKNKGDAPKIRMHQRSEYERRFVLRVNIDNRLKICLQDDNEFIIRQRKLIPVPAPKSVSEILREFAETFKQDENEYDSMKKAMIEIEEYFNKILGARLLYKFERPSFADYLAPFRDENSDAQLYPRNAEKPAKIFGFTHLVRLIYHLDEVLGDVDIEKEIIQRHLRDLQRLSDHLAPLVGEYHLPEHYIETSPEYHRRAQV